MKYIVLVTALFCGLMTRGSSDDPCGVCKNGGTLVVTENGLSCKCPALFKGTLCQNPAIVCKNGGTAVVDASGNAACKCPLGFTGADCGDVVPKPDCKNGGNAVLGNNNQYTCTCPALFTGPLCEDPAITCKNGGTAVVDASGKPACNCPLGFTGADCGDAVPKPDCKNGGTAVLGNDNKYTCLCGANNFGDLCEKGCSPGFTLLKDATGNVGCYMFVVKGQNWDQATAFCTSNNAKLAVVDNARENTAIKNSIKAIIATKPADLSQCNGQQFLIAGRRLKDGDCTKGTPNNNFYWVTPGSDPVAIKPPSSFTDWYGANPDCDKSGSSLPNESCINYWPSGNYQWNDYVCQKPTCSVCEGQLVQ
jgi:hypothetical protein